MGGLLGSPRVVPLFVVFFVFNSTDLSRFIWYRHRMEPDQDEKKEFKSGLPAIFTQNYQNIPMNESWPKKSVQRHFFRVTQGRNPMLARGDDGGRATVRN